MFTNEHNKRLVTIGQLKLTIASITIAIVLLATGAFLGITINDKQITDNQKEDCSRANYRIDGFNRLATDTRSLYYLLGNLISGLEVSPKNKIELNIAREKIYDLSKSVVTLNKVDCDKEYK